jgi:hypothetical protein
MLLISASGSPDVAGQHRMIGSITHGSSSVSPLSPSQPIPAMQAVPTKSVALGRRGSCRPVSDPSRTAAAALHPFAHHHRYQRCRPNWSPLIAGGVAGRRGGVAPWPGHAERRADGKRTGCAGCGVSSGGPNGSNGCLLDWERCDELRFTGF